MESKALREREDMLRDMEIDAQADFIENLSLVARLNTHTGEEDLSDPDILGRFYAG